MISVGRFRASGLIGWFAWLGIHIAFLTTFRNRFGAILTWALAFSRESRRERAFTMQQIVAGGSVYQASTLGRGIRSDPAAPPAGTAPTAGETPPDAGERPVRAGGAP